MKQNKELKENNLPLHLRNIKMINVEAVDLNKENMRLFYKPFSILNKI